MRHAVRSRHFGRNKGWRKATVRSLAQAVVKYERIETTLAKAKETQRFVERLVTLGKKQTLAARRRAIALLADSRIVHRLFTEIAPRFSSREGGYTRVLHGGYRPGDGASLAILEFVELAPERKPDYEEVLKGKQEKKKARAEKGSAEAPSSAQPTAKPSAPVAESRKSVSEKPAREVQTDKPKEKDKPKAGEFQRPKKDVERSRGLMGGLRKLFQKRRNQ